MSLYKSLSMGEGRLCHAWCITRKDGAIFAFTDHDEALEFENKSFLPSGSLSQSEQSRSAGPSVDGGEVVGVLQHSAISEADLSAGRFDAAEIEMWRLDWADVSKRDLVFRGSLGEITLEGPRWRAEVRGLTEPLSKPIGRSYQRLCTSVVGDNKCRFALEAEGFSFETSLAGLEHAQHLLLPSIAAAERWFERGRVEILTGAAKGLLGIVKADQIEGVQRRITLWTPLAAKPAPGDLLRITAGCDKRLETCRGKFGNVANFGGFPFMPGESWWIATPKGEGESLFR